jgi:hypothetical protein
MKLEIINSFLCMAPVVNVRSARHWDTRLYWWLGKHKDHETSDDMVLLTRIF